MKTFHTLMHVAMTITGEYDGSCSDGASSLAELKVRPVNAMSLRHLEVRGWV